MLTDEGLTATVLLIPFCMAFLLRALVLLWIATTLEAQRTWAAWLGLIHTALTMPCAFALGYLSGHIAALGILFPYVALTLYFTYREAQMTLKGSKGPPPQPPGARMDLPRSTAPGFSVIPMDSFGVLKRSPLPTYQRPPRSSS